MPIRGVPSPCLECAVLTAYGTRCEECTLQRNRITERHRQRGTRHYDSAYRKAAKAVRDSAETCWICGVGAIENDPWTADHLFPGDRQSPLAPAHRSCNSRRGNKTVEEVRGGGKTPGWA